MPGPPCIFHAFTGWPCPGCGATRALRALAHFDFGGALAMNPLLTVALVVGLGGAALRWVGVRPAGLRWSPWLIVVLVGLVLLNWAYLISAGR